MNQPSAKAIAKKQAKVILYHCREWLTVQEVCDLAFFDDVDVMGRALHELWLKGGYHRATRERTYTYRRKEETHEQAEDPTEDGQHPTS